MASTEPEKILVMVRRHVPATADRRHAEPPSAR
jgi:hypothetical protein